jgi:hypothetical protein
MDMVSFTDLDTKNPKLESNGGQSRLVVVFNDDEKVTLLNLGNNQTDAAEMYTIFRKKGVVIYSQQKDSTFIGPFGVLEMGYCR